jgi:hypothetical protein
MVFKASVESRILEAIDRGAFDRLPGAGRPLDLSPYFMMPGDVRVAHALLKDAGILPVEAQLMREIAELKESRAAIPDAQEQKRLEEQINSKLLCLNLRLERLCQRAG